jgi:tetratricopeptide (TPR) repeat protein
VRVDLALASVYLQLDELEKAVTVTRRIAAAAPDSATAFMIHTGALLASGDVAEVQRLAQARLEKTANDVQALRMLSQAAAQAGDYEKANVYSRRIIETSDAGAGDYNNMAWNSLFIGKALDAAIEDANHAVSFGEDASAMHTLAALYAEVGNSLEARTKLLESLDVAGREEPSSADWYVLGRIAENYGAPEAALAAYKRVQVPKRKDFSSTYELAQRRVKSLAKR